MTISVKLSSGQYCHTYHVSQECPLPNPYSNRCSWCVGRFNIFLDEAINYGSSYIVVHKNTYVHGKQFDPLENKPLCLLTGVFTRTPCYSSFHYITSGACSSQRMEIISLTLAFFAPYLSLGLKAAWLFDWMPVQHADCMINSPKFR